MAFFGYDPYGYNPCDYYYTPTAAPYNHPYDPYYQRRQPAASTRSRRSTAKPAPTARDTETSFEIPIHGPDSDLEPEPKQKAPPAMSAREAAVRIQAAARGFVARKSVRAVPEVTREATKISAGPRGPALTKIASETAVALLAEDPRARATVGEALMRMLLRLDAVRGAREYRKRVTKLVLALQDAVDALKTKPALAPAPAPVGEEAEADAPEATAVEMAEEITVAPELPDDADHSCEMESIKTAVDTPTQVEVDETITVGDLVAEAKVAEAVPGDANVDVDEPADSDAEGEWEIVTEENEHPAAVVDTSNYQEAPCKEPACPLEITRTASAGAASDGVDASKVMEMVAALCEQNAKQCAMIGALVERVDALERTVRRMEDAGREPPPAIQEGEHGGQVN